MQTRKKYRKYKKLEPRSKLPTLPVFDASDYCLYCLDIIVFPATLPHSPDRGPKKNVSVHTATTPICTQVLITSTNPNNTGNCFVEADEVYRRNNKRMPAPPIAEKIWRVIPAPSMPLRPFLFLRDCHSSATLAWHTRVGLNGIHSSRFVRGTCTVQQTTQVFPSISTIQSWANERSTELHSVTTFPLKIFDPRAIAKPLQCIVQQLRFPACDQALSSHASASSPSQERQDSLENLFLFQASHASKQARRRQRR